MPFRQWQRIFILFLLCLSFLTPIVLLSNRLSSLTSHGRREFIEEFASVRKRQDALRLDAVEEDLIEGVEEPIKEIYNDQGKLKSEDSGKGNDYDYSDEGETTRIQSKKEPSRIGSERAQDPRLPEVQHHQNSHSRARRSDDEIVMRMKDQLVRAKVYMSFATSGGKNNLMKELKLRMKELERVLDVAQKDSDLSKSDLQKMRNMGATLQKASHIYQGCASMTKKLRAMIDNVQGRIRAQMIEERFLSDLTGRTTTKGLHCLSMRLTTEYFTLQPHEQELPNPQNALDPDLLHYVVFSDNVLACAVVVNSTVTNSMEPEKIVFHVVTNYVNYPAISMWFLLNPPGNATIQVRNMDKFKWFSEHGSILEKLDSRNPRFFSPLNRLRFYLPEIFPHLNKIVFLDHDVVVQRDLGDLWDVDMKGKVNGAVETCPTSNSSYYRMDMFINFSDPYVAKEFNADACAWAFGMNLFDLREWRHQDLTNSYRRFLQTGLERRFLKSGTLPLGWLTFYNQTLALDSHWHLTGLGRESGVKLEDIEQASVIHYDGIMKPWLDLGITEYRPYWSKYVDFHHPFLQQCNIRE